MKQYLLVCIMLLSFGQTAMAVQPRHRHQQVTTAVVQADSTKQQSLEAYSDTSAAAPQASQDSVIVENEAQYDHEVDDPIDRLSQLMEHKEGLGVMRDLFASGVVMMVFVFLFLPLIIVLLIIFLLYKRHKDRVRLAEKAMEMGQPVPESMWPVNKQTYDYLWKRGIRNISIAVGLSLMFAIWGAEELAGIGILVACYGVGQLIIARHSQQKKTDEQQDDLLK